MSCLQALWVLPSAVQGQSTHLWLHWHSLPRGHTFFCRSQQTAAPTQHGMRQHLQASGSWLGTAYNTATLLHGHAQVCASPLLGSALQSTHRGAAVATACAVNGAGCPRPHRPDFRTQKRLIRIWRAALCHVSWMCKGAAAACVLLLPLAGFHLRHVRHQQPQRVTALGE